MFRHPKYYKNYESYVIKRTRPLAQKLATASASVRLVRAPSFKLGRPLPLTQRVGLVAFVLVRASSFVMAD